MRERRAHGEAMLALGAHVLLGRLHHLGRPRADHRPAHVQQPPRVRAPQLADACMQLCILASPICATNPKSPIITYVSASVSGPNTHPHTVKKEAGRKP